MRSYAYRAEFEPGERRGNIVVTFPDVPEVVTQGRSEADARVMAEEALGLALLSYLQRGLPLPKPRARGRRLVEIAIAPDVAAKLAVLEAFAAAGISKSELARRIGKGDPKGKPSPFLLNTDGAIAMDFRSDYYHLPRSKFLER